MSSPSKGQLIVVAGPPLAGKRELARALVSRRRARYLAAGSGGLAADDVRRAIAAGEDVVVDGAFVTRSEREEALALGAAGGGSVLVSWSCSAREAERMARRRFAARPRYVEEHELEQYRDDARRREPIGDEVALERVAVVSGSVPLWDQLLAVEALLPRRSEAAPAAETPRRGRIRRVLAVDDDDDVREALVGVLEELGYAVAGAASGAEALARLDRAEGGAYDLVVADQRMPGMSGTELIAAVHERYPAVRTLLLTGYGDDPTCAAALDAEAATVLAKPLRVMDLRRALDEALA